MKNEAQFKLAFKKSASLYQGHAMSLAAPMVVGIPDLYVIMPGYLPILLEAKWLRNLPERKFSRKLPFTWPQKLWIERCHNITNFSAMGLIGFNWVGKIYAILVSHDSPMFDTIDPSFMDTCSFVVYDKPKKSFDIPTLFAKVPIPKITTGIGTDDLYISDMAVRPYHPEGSADRSLNS